MEAPCALSQIEGPQKDRLWFRGDTRHWDRLWFRALGLLVMDLGGG